MNGHERITDALEGKPTDSIPIMLHNFQMAAHEYGISMEQFREDPKNMATAFIKSIEKYELDGILIDMDTTVLAGAIGVPIDYPVNEAARTSKGRLKHINEISTCRPPQIENHKYVQNCLEAVRQVKDYFKNEVFVRGNCDQLPFSLASMFCGLENWMTGLLLEEEDLLFEVLDYCEEASSQFINLMAQTDCDMLSNGDSPAGPDLLPPNLYEKFAFPYEKKIIQQCHQLGLPYCLHICGNTELILEKMIETGSDALELDYKTDTQKTYDVLHDKTTLIGNIDPSGVLAMGTPDKVREKTIDLLTIFSKTNRFILNAGCAIPATTPPENIRMMIRTAREY